MAFAFCKRYFPLLSVLVFVVSGVARGAVAQPTAPQDWDTTVKKAEEEGQVS